MSYQLTCEVHEIHAGAAREGIAALVGHFGERSSHITPITKEDFGECRGCQVILYTHPAFYENRQISLRGEEAAVLNLATELREQYAANKHGIEWKSP
ncbi:MAG: hypothetical protein AABY26_05790 [Nanoarchaeota archaeon]